MVAAPDMGLLLESRIGEFASTATTRVSRKGRLWARSLHCVKAKQWGLSYSCFYRPGKRTTAWRKIKPTQMLPCMVIGHQANGERVRRLLVPTMQASRLRYVARLRPGGRQKDSAQRLAGRWRSRPWSLVLSPLVGSNPNSTAKSPAGAGPATAALAAFRKIQNSTQDCLDCCSTGEVTDSAFRAPRWARSPVR
jgi:hypothetical protein